MKKRSLPSWASTSPSSSNNNQNNNINTSSDNLSSTLLTNNDQQQLNNTTTNNTTSDQHDNNRNYLSPFEMSKKRKIEQDLELIPQSSSSQNDDITNNQIFNYSNLIKPNKELINKYINFYMKCERVIFLDSETTGFTKNDQVIELAAIEIINGQKTGLIFNSRIKLNENVKIHEKAFEVHKISENDLITKPNSEFIYSNFIEFLKDKNNLTTGIVGHNLQFDLRMIKQDLLKYLFKNETDKLPNILMDTNRHFCTMNFYKNIRGKNHSYDLDSTLHYFGINKKTRQDKHSAIHDTELTFELFKSLKQYIELNLNNNTLSINDYYIKHLLINNNTNNNNNMIDNNNVNNNTISSTSSLSVINNDNTHTNSNNTEESNNNNEMNINEDYSIFSYIKDLFKWF